jgi:hypothetical protein
MSLLRALLAGLAKRNAAPVPGEVQTQPGLDRQAPRIWKPEREPGPRSARVAPEVGKDEDPLGPDRGLRTVARKASDVFDAIGRGEDALDAFLSLPVSEQMAALEEELSKLKPDEIRLVQEVLAAELGKVWLPLPGPQTQAYNSPADVLLYGGAAGGGKSELALGLALTAHKRSLIMRREGTSMTDMIDRAIEIAGSRDGFNGSPPPTLRRPDGRVITFGSALHSGDETKYQGRPRDLLVIDEAAQWLEAMVRYLMGWVRTTEEGQRTRTVLCSNPPTSPDEGQWLISMFAPWLDPSFPDRALSGELRWVVTDEEGRDRWVDGPQPVEVDGEIFTPKSRTFIPASVDDNPYLIRSGYKAQLQSLPEPLRSAMLRGDWFATREDAANQVIPADWIIAAQQRWQPKPPMPMTSIGVDVAQGGADNTTLAPRHGSWFAPLKMVKGIDTKDGASVAGLVLATMRDGALVAIDLGGGWGGAAYEHLTGANIEAVGCVPSSGSTRKTKDGKLTFANARAEWWWVFREALDPNGGAYIALPPDPDLVAELVAPRWKLGPRGILIESKNDIRKRLGRSTDKADAVVMAWSHGSMRQKDRLDGRHRPRVNLGHADTKSRRR